MEYWSATQGGNSSLKRLPKKKNLEICDVNILFFKNGQRRIYWKRKKYSSPKYLFPNHVDIQDEYLQDLLQNNAKRQNRYHTTGTALL